MIQMVFGIVLTFPKMVRIIIIIIIVFNQGGKHFVIAFDHEVFKSGTVNFLHAIPQLHWIIFPSKAVSTILYWHLRTYYRHVLSWLHSCYAHTCDMLLLLLFLSNEIHRRH
jgi:hypothetical protein